MARTRRDPRWTIPAGLLLVICIGYNLHVATRPHPNYITPFKIWGSLAVIAILVWLILRCPKVKA